MSTLKFLKNALASVVVVSAAVLSGTVAAQEAVTIRVSHFLPPGAAMHKLYLADWKNRVEEQSNGQISVRIFPSMQLGGTPASLYDQVKDGQVDMVYTLPGYTPDRFPKTEVFDLPFIGRSNAATAQAAHEFFTQHLQEEYGDVHVLTFFTHSPGALHTKSAPVRKAEDMRRLKVRAPNRVIAQYMEDLGAQSVGMPLSQVPESLTLGVIDGAIMPLESVGALRLHEIVRNHTIFPNEEMLYTTGMFIAMNKARYDSLPEDLRAVIDANSGVGEALQISRILDSRDEVVLNDIKSANKNTVIAITGDEMDSWKQATQKVKDEWFRKMNDLGFDGEQLYDDASALVQKYSASQ